MLDTAAVVVTPAAIPVEEGPPGIPEVTPQAISSATFLAITPEARTRRSRRLLITATMLLF